MTVTARTINTGKLYTATALIIALMTISWTAAAQGAPKKDKVETKPQYCIAGKWKCQWENQWGEEGELAIVATGKGNNKYELKAAETFDSWAETVMVMQGELGKDGKLTISGNSDVWTGKGTAQVRGDVIRGEFKGNESGKIIMRRLCSVTGRWNCQWENQSGDAGEFAIEVARSGFDAYKMTVKDSFDSWAETVMVMQGKLDDNCKLSFTGNSDVWTGTGAVAVAGDQMAGQYQGTEDGRLTMSKVCSITGKWLCNWSSEFGDDGQFAIIVSDLGLGEYELKVKESFDSWAKTIMVMQGKMDDNCKLTFSANSNAWDGTGSVVVTGDAMKGKFKGTESGKLEIRRAPANAEKNFTGKWRGNWETEYGDACDFAATVTEIGYGQYEIKILDSFETDAETHATLKARLDDFGQVTFTGEGNSWTGNGKGFVASGKFKGTFDGNETGKFIMQKKS